MNEFDNIVRADPVANACPSCGSIDVFETQEVDRFVYGEGASAVDLSVPIQVIHCRRCDFSYSTEDVSDARHNAVCAHFGVLNPNEIRAIRERYGASQAEFAEISRIGKASLARWEGGLLIQNASNDALLRLLAEPRNYQALKERVVKNNKPRQRAVAFKGKFRALIADEITLLEREARTFELYPQSCAC